MGGGASGAGGGGVYRKGIEGKMGISSRVPSIPHQ